MKNSIYLIIILLTSSCTQDITSADSVSEFKVTFFDYLPGSATLYLYTEIENDSNANSIDSVWVHVYKQNIGLVFSTELTQLYLNSYSYQQTVPPFDSGNYYVKYYLREINGVTLSLTTNIKFLSAHEGNAVPEYINIDVPDIFYIDDSEWQELPIYLTIYDLNGKDNIQNVKYEIRRFFVGCNEDVNCIINSDCHENIEDMAFQSDETWHLEFIDYNEEGFIYARIILMRPLDGSGFANEQIEFSAEDCGRTGLMFIRFIITDRDGNIKTSDEIIIEILSL